MAVTHTVRRKDGDGVETITNYRKARGVRRFCLECMCFQWGQVKECSAPLCPLFPFRFGNEKGLSEENTAHLKDFVPDESIKVTEEEDEDDWADEISEEEE